MNILVCIKQVPDTTEVKLDPKTGTLIRDGIPSIINPDDKAGLEEALKIKEKTGATVTVITMGPMQADLALREAIAMGADKGILLTDRAFAGADTWATSSAIAGAIKKMDYDLIIAGRQAIDGDTAQVGPQVAEKLGIPQVTYAEKIVSVEGNEIVIVRRLEHGTETVKAKLPLLVTVNGSADECRPRNTKMLQRNKYAKTPSEKASLTDTALYEKRPYLNLGEWSAADVDADLSQTGLAGSPTKVKQVENVVFQAKESKRLTTADEVIDELMKELITNHTIG